MAVKAGDQIPDVELKTIGAEGTPVVVNTRDTLGKGKVILFAVPGAFTPGCSKIHLPGFVANADELKSKGVDLIACTAVNDAWVMKAWADSQGVGDKILMLADGSGVFARAMGLELDVSKNGMGQRSKRYAMVIENGIIASLDVDNSGVDVSSCEAVMSKL